MIINTEELLEEIKEICESKFEPEGLNVKTKEREE